MDYAADRIQGARDYQQDEFGIVDGNDLIADGEALKVFVVADGMGGHQSGEEASAAAIVAFVHRFAATQGPVSDRLRATLDAANQALHQKIQDQPDLRGMGTTLIAAAVTATTLQWISVGDSKLRLYKAATGELQRVNADHSMAPVVEALERDAQSTAGLDRHGLRSALLGEDIAMVDLSSQPIGLQPGDVLLLASDGLDVLSDDEIGDALAGAEEEGAERTVRRLLEAVEAHDLPDQDNTTALVIVPRPRAAGASKLAAQSLSKIPRLWIYACGIALLVLLAALFMLGGDTEPDADRQPDSGPASELDTVDIELPERPVDRTEPPVPDDDQAEHVVEAEDNNREDQEDQDD